MRKEIQLGDTVECVHTGFTGIAVARTEFINGCVQINVLPKSKDGKSMPEEIGIDIESLKIIKKKKTIQTKPKGGANRIGIKQRCC